MLIKKKKRMFKKINFNIQMLYKKMFIEKYRWKILYKNKIKYILFKQIMIELLIK